MTVRAVRYLVRAVGSVGLLAGTLAVAAYLFHSLVLNAPGPHESDTLILVESGDGHATIRWSLKRANVISDVYLYDAARLWQGTSFMPKAGEYLIPVNATLADTMAIIHKGRSYQRRLTIIEGLRSDEIKNQLNAAKHLVGKVENLPKEGSILPETYFYTFGMTRQSLLDHMQQKRELLLIESWIERDKDLPLDSREDAIILASIVEKESSDPQERRLVAGVFVNRLKRGMRLQSDPTVLFGVSSNPDRAITKADLKRKTPWNTYQMSGLPKTAICNPGEDAILATLNPAKTDYLYFVSDAKGGLLFAKTLDAHNRNVRLFRKTQKAQRKANVAK